MKKIQMVDLQNQYYKIKSEVDNAVLNVMDSAAFINGPEVKSFQSDLENYLDVINEICAVCVTAPLSQMTIDSLSYEMLNCLESKINSLKEIAEQRNYRYMLDFILGVQNVY